MIADTLFFTLLADTTNPPVFRGYLTTNTTHTSLSAASLTPVQSTASSLPGIDNYKRWNGTTYTVPASGIYLVTAMVNANNPIALYKNGALWSGGYLDIVHNVSSQVQDLVQCAEGDTLALYFNSTGNALTYLAITRVSG